MREMTDKQFWLLPGTADMLYTIAMTGKEIPLKTIERLSETAS